MRESEKEEEEMKDVEEEEIEEDMGEEEVEEEEEQLTRSCRMSTIRNSFVGICRFITRLFVYGKTHFNCQW